MLELINIAKAPLLSKNTPDLDPVGLLLYKLHRTASQLLFVRPEYDLLGEASKLLFSEYLTHKPKDSDQDWDWDWDWDALDL